MKRVLVANIFGIGDVLFTTPLIANLKKEIEGISVDYLCNARARDIVESNPDVDEIFVYEKDFFVKLWGESRLRCLKALYELFSVVRRKRYDAVFDFTLSREFGLFFTLAGIPRRIGLDYKNRGLFLTEKVPLLGFEDRHVIEYYLDLLRPIGEAVSIKEMQLVPCEDTLEWARTFLEEKGARGAHAIVAVIPGGGASWGGKASRKRWGAGGFSRAADILAANGVKIALLGDPSETDLCRDVAGGMKEHIAIVENSLTLKQYIALLSQCDLVLCNDGGPLHVAGALGVKTVSIFGPVDDKIYGPYPTSDRHRVIKAREVPCRPCYNRFKLPECVYENKCLTGIDPETVAEACLKLLGQKR
ncbi:MAG: glycosyltransferase family 9 protein [Candidatus Omnitrophota bacterium]